LTLAERLLMAEREEKPPRTLRQRCMDLVEFTELEHGLTKRPPMLGIARVTAT